MLSSSLVSKEMASLLIWCTFHCIHNTLLNLMGIKDYHGRLGKQAMFLQEYNFTIKYLPEKDNGAADQRADVMSKCTRIF